MITSEKQTLKEVMQVLKTDHVRFNKKMRKDSPISEVEDVVFAFKLEDVHEILAQPEVFTVDLYKPKMAEYLMAYDNEPKYLAEKKLMMGILRPEDLPDIQNFVSKLADEVLQQDKPFIEMISAYTRYIPTKVVQKFFGLHINSNRLMKWSYWNQYNTFHNQPFDSYDAEKQAYISLQHKKGSKSLTFFITVLMAKNFLKVKLVHSDFVGIRGLRSILNSVRSWAGKSEVSVEDNSLTRMLLQRSQSNENLSLVRVAVNAGGLLIGAVETTSQAVAQILKEISKHPHVLLQAQRYAHSDTEKFQNLLFEVFRFVPISPYLFRKASKDTVIAKGTDREHKVRKGQIVLAVTGSAMFDEEAYQNPSQLDIAREPIPHYHLGVGAHECMGRHIGEVMIVEMVRKVLLETPMSQPLDLDYKDSPFPESCHLPLRD